MHTHRRSITRREILARCSFTYLTNRLWGTRIAASGLERWAVCYGAIASDLQLVGYDLVVLDPDHHPPIAALLNRKKPALAYVSLTQIGRGRAVFADLTAAGVIGDRHGTWSNSHYVDFRRPEWMQVVLERLVPDALKQGFSGLFLDTLDDAEYLERLDPVRYQGMRDAGVRLVRALRARYPDALLMVNRGYALMPQLATSIDMLLGESVAGTFEPATKAYRRQSPADLEWQVAALRNAQSLNPALKVYTLDYWAPGDTDTIRALYREQRARGFIPYVATPDLDQLIPEPR